MGRAMTAMTKALTFAHLAPAAPDTNAAGAEAGVALAPGAKRAGNDRPDPDDDPGKQGRRAEGDDNGDDDRDAEDPHPDGGDDDDDKGSGKGKRGRKAKRARAQDDEGDESDDDDDETEMRGHSEAASARRREQARCAAIFASKAAAFNPALAANLAFRTRLPRSEAVAMLEASPPAVVSGPANDRAARNPRVGPGNSMHADSRQAIAASWDHAFAKVNPRSH